MTIVARGNDAAMAILVFPRSRCAFPDDEKLRLLGQPVDASWCCNNVLRLPAPRARLQVRVVSVGVIVKYDR